jgi:hypothetical protein
VKNKLQFRGLNLVQQLDDRLKKLIGTIECTTCKRFLDMTEKPEAGQCQVRTVREMRNSNERISIRKTVLTHSKNEPDNCRGAWLFLPSRKVFASKGYIICARKYSVLKGPPGGMPSYRRREIRQFPKSLSI